MTPSERVRAVYHRESPDYVPFTIYETKVAGRPYERELMDLGICCIRRLESFRIVQEGEVTVEKTRTDLPGGHYILRSVTHTPFGDLSKTEEYDAITAWTSEYPFKDESDYEKLCYLFDNQRAVPRYDALTADCEEDTKKGSVLVRTHLPHEPVSDLLGYIMGPETWCYEWMDNRDKLLSLHFPSAWQLHDEKQIAKDTIGLIEAAKDPRRLIIGITEDAPMDRYVPIVRGIMAGIREFGPLK